MVRMVGQTCVVRVRGKVKESVWVIHVIPRLNTGNTKPLCNQAAKLLNRRSLKVWVPSR